MKNEIVPIQYLRGLAALLVVSVHTLEQQNWLSTFFPYSFGHSGVDLFFVISGFIMIYTTHTKDISPQKFMLNRIKRIVPLYWFFTSCLILIALLAPNIVRSFEFDAFHILSSYFFIAYSSPVSGFYWPVLIPGWTLNYEMFFYVVFAFSLFLKRPYQFPVLFAVLTIPAILNIFAEQRTLLSFYTNPIILEFLFGALLGAVFIYRGLPKSNLLGITLILVGVLYYYLVTSFTEPHRAFSAGIASTIIVLGALMIQIKDIKSAKHHLLHLLGNASYSIYLSHVFSLGLLRFILNKVQVEPSFMNGLIIIFSALVLSSIVGVLAYFFVERPLIKMFRKRA